MSWDLGKIDEIIKKKAILKTSYESRKDTKLKNIDENITNQVNLNEENIKENMKEFKKYDTTNPKITDSKITDYTAPNPTQESLNLYKEPHIVYDEFFDKINLLDSTLNIDYKKGKEKFNLLVNKDLINFK